MAVLMRSVSGIRGIVGQSLTPEVLVAHVRAFLRLIGANTIVLGRDSRPSGPAIADLVSATCRMAGVRVIDIGLATTPTVELAVVWHRAQGGIILTASHNPVEWNALKFLDARGMFLGPDQVRELFRMADTGESVWADWNQIAERETQTGADAKHCQEVMNLPFVDVRAIASARIRVAVDAVNGAGSWVVPQLLEQLGCEVVRVHCTPDGKFPRVAEPLPEHLQALGQAVREHACALGLALDPDADRCALVDRQGRAIGEEYTLAIAADTVLDRVKGPIAINLSTSRMNEDVAARHGVSCLRAPVGEIHVSLAMMQAGCVIGGEGNGGVILPALHYGRDALVAAALVLDWMARKGKGVEHFVAENPAYHMPKKKFALGKRPVQEILQDVRRLFSDWKADERDGLWLGGDRAWLHVRASNTEPVIRVIAEAPTAAEAESLCQKVESLIF